MREILNYVVAAEEGFHWIAERPLTVNLLGNLQRILVQGTHAAYSDAGGLRDTQVLIGARGSAIQEARFVPPLRAISCELGWKTGSRGSTIRQPISPR